MKKLTASFLIAVTLWASVIAPAKAVFPIIGAVYLASVDALGATLTHTLIASAALHAGVAAIELTSDSSAPSSNGSNSAIQIQLDPYTPLTTPASALAPATSPYTQTQVVVSDAQEHPVYHTYVGSFLSASDAISAINAVSANCKWTYTSEDRTRFYSTYSCKDGSTGNSADDVSYVFGCPSGSSWDGSHCVETVNTCPPGYTMNTTTQSCNRNNDDVQVPDNKIQITRSGDTMQQNPNDPDPIPENLLVRPKDVVISSPERTTTVHINDDGTIEVKDITLSNGNTNVDKLKLSAPTPGQAPQVIGKSNQQYPGQESGPADPDATVNSPVIPGTESGTPSSPATGTSVLNLPANLAKTEKQCGYDAEHPCKVELKNEALESTELSTGQFETAASDHLSNLQGVGEGGDHGFSWSWNPFESINAGACTPPQFHVGFVDLNFSDFCTKIAWVRDLLGFVIYVSTGMALFSIMTGKREE